MTREVVVNSRATWDQNAELFKQTSLLARLGGWELDVATDVVRWSPLLFEIFELPQGAPLLGDAISFYHPDDQSTITAAVAEAIEHGVSYDLELRVITATGKLVHVRTTGKPDVENGQLVRLWGFLQDITDRVEREAAAIESNRVLQEAYAQTIEALIQAIDARDPYTALHQRNVSRLAVAIAESLGLPEETIKGVGFGAMLHDLGKIAIPLDILNKPGTLSPLEYELVKTHAQVGYEIIADVEYPWPILDIVHQHHERIDGSGYPAGLRGDEISLEARIVAVADVVEAMSSHRPYRPTLGLDMALQEIIAHRGVLYDADVVDACVRLFREGAFEFAPGETRSGTIQPQRPLNG